MILIAHRGNVNGPKPERENTTDYIEEALSLGYEAEIDVWGRSQLWLGHDKAENPCPIKFLMKHRKKLWIHCKNLEAMHTLREFPSLNFFWHEEDRFTLTSQRFIWTYPGNRVCNKSVVVMRDIKEHNGQICFGICADYLK